MGKATVASVYRLVTEREALASYLGPLLPEGGGQLSLPERTKPPA